MNIAHYTYGSFGFAMAKTDEDSITGVGGFYIFDCYIFECAAINRFKRNGRAVGIGYFYIAYFNVLKSSMRSSTKLQGAGAGAHHAIADLDVLTKRIGIARF